LWEKHENVFPSPAIPENSRLHKGNFFFSKKSQNLLFFAFVDGIAFSNPFVPQFPVNFRDPSFPRAMASASFPREALNPFPYP